ncbi:MAG: hypothetical protein WBM78_17575, partial [Desulfobacterales bacterium]
LLEMSIVENIQREGFNPIEESEAYHRLITEFELTQDQAAERVVKVAPRWPIFYVSEICRNKSKTASSTAL